MSFTCVRLLDRGGDDVIAKPFSYPELRGFQSSYFRQVSAKKSAVPAPTGPSASVLGGPLRIAPKRREMPRAREENACTPVPVRLQSLTSSERLGWWSGGRAEQKVFDAPANRQRKM
jgi:DNA-binding response OmpR family regulator